jgi:hypothetical protein
MLEWSDRIEQARVLVQDEDDRDRSARPRLSNLADLEIEPGITDSELWGLKGGTKFALLLICYLT